MPVSRLNTVRPLLVGEDNPYGADPYYALYPAPRGCAGHRLCSKVMGMSKSAYLDAFDRMNLCNGKWRVREARDTAQMVWSHSVDIKRPAIILLGRKVAAAFQSERRGVPPPFTLVDDATGVKVVYLPHPSGLCREWNAPGSFDRARELLREAGVIA